MKYHIFITKREIITIIIFIVGLILLFNGIHSAYKYNHALNLNTLKEYELKDGAYVIGNIDTYVGQRLSGSNHFSGVSKSIITSGKVYDFYTIPVGSKSYICIMAYSKSLLEQLEAFENGHGKDIYFEGEVIEPLTDLNLNWYTQIDDFHTEDLINSFVIRETNFGKNKQFIYAGVLLLAMAALLFFSAGGVKNLIVKKDHDI